MSEHYKTFNGLLSAIVSSCHEMQFERREAIQDEMLSNILKYPEPVMEEWLYTLQMLLKYNNDQDKILKAVSIWKKKHGKTEDTTEPTY